MKNILFFTITLLSIFSCRNTEPTVAPIAQKNTDSIVGYKEDVEQIMNAYCANCHSKVTYITNLSTYEALKTRADSGVLYDRLFVKSDMPPQGNPKPSDKNLQTIKDWINTGCKP